MDGEQGKEEAKWSDDDGGIEAEDALQVKIPRLELGEEGREKEKDVIEVMDSDSDMELKPGLPKNEIDSDSDDSIISIPPISSLLDNCLDDIEVDGNVTFEGRSSQHAP